MRLWVKILLLAVTALYAVFCVLFAGPLFVNTGINLGLTQNLITETALIFVLLGLVLLTLRAFSRGKHGWDKRLLALSGSLLAIGIVAVLIAKFVPSGTGGSAPTPAVSPTPAQEQVQIDFPPAVTNGQMVLTPEQYKEVFNTYIRDEHPKMGELMTAQSGKDLVVSSALSNFTVAFVCDGETKNIKTIRLEAAPLNNMTEFGYYLGTMIRLFDPASATGSLQEYIDALKFNKLPAGGQGVYEKNGFKFVNAVEENKETFIIEPASVVK